MEDPISKKVFVGNLSFEVTDVDLKQAFAAVGTVVSARVITDRTTGKSRGFGIVEFTDEQHAADAIRKCHDQPLKGRNMRVNDADDRPPKRPAPGVPPTFSFSGFESTSGFDSGDGPPRFKSKGSRRGLRKRKRSL
ncbi:MAG: RNA-binding protein [Acidobacteria bacterium]|nr:RNA-binding protein [Acidobacteriota bacterium]